MVIDNIESMIPLVPFIGRALGGEAEVVLQKTAGENQGVIAIYGGRLSGRKVGDPLSEAVRVLRDTGAYRDGEVLEKQADQADRHTPLKTSVLFLTDEAGALLGTLHINTDLSDYIRLGKRLLAFAGVTPEEAGGEKNAYSRAAEQAAAGAGIALLDETLYELRLLGIPLDRLTDAERRSVVGIMNLKGAFDYKGAVPETAAALGISESTVYRYIARQKGF